MLLINQGGTRDKVIQLYNAKEGGSSNKNRKVGKVGTATTFLNFLAGKVVAVPTFYFYSR